MVISRGYVVAPCPVLRMSCFTTISTRIQQSILVDAASHARITDFGLATIAQSVDTMRRNSDDQDPATRWTAPEILDGAISSKESDVFSFAMVMIEVRHEWVICEL